jgi:hypothetical protein
MAIRNRAPGATPRAHWLGYAIKGFKPTEVGFVYVAATFSRLVQNIYINQEAMPCAFPPKYASVNGKPFDHHQRQC